MEDLPPTKNNNFESYNRLIKAIRLLIIKVTKMSHLINYAYLIIIITCLWNLQAAEKTDSLSILGDIELFKSRKTNIKVFPYVYYTPETSLAFGVGGIITFYTSQYRLLRPSKISLSGYYTINKQFKFSISPQMYFYQNMFLLLTDLNYGHYVDRYYGVGNDTPDIENASYNSNAWGFYLNMQLPPLLKEYSHTKIGIIFDLYHYKITDIKENPYLTNQTIEGDKGKISSGFGFIWVWDNRNSIFYPTSGGLHQIKAIFYFKQIGSDFVFNHYELDLRQYLKIRERKVLAFQLFGQFVKINAPFYELAKLGGQRIMRGYFEGRYRDKNYVAFQSEFRSHIWGRLGYVLFIGTGDVAKEIKDLDLLNMKISAGFGLRFIFNKEENVNIRTDIGFGKNSSGVYFGIEESF